MRETIVVVIYHLSACEGLLYMFLNLTYNLIFIIFNLFSLIKILTISERVRIMVFNATFNNISFIVLNALETHIIQQALNWLDKVLPY